jgi:hypothetical protein
VTDAFSSVAAGLVPHGHPLVRPARKGLHEERLRGRDSFLSPIV